MQSHTLHGNGSAWLGKNDRPGWKLPEMSLVGREIITNLKKIIPTPTHPNPRLPTIFFANHFLPSHAARCSAWLKKNFFSEIHFWIKWGIFGFLKSQSIWINPFWASKLKILRPMQSQTLHGTDGCAWLGKEPSSRVKSTGNVFRGLRNDHLFENNDSHPHLPQFQAADHILCGATQRGALHSWKKIFFLIYIFWSNEVFSDSFNRNQYESTHLELRKWILPKIKSRLKVRSQG